MASFHTSASPSPFAARSSDLLHAAARAEHEIFKSTKSSNLYKAGVLKKVAELKKAAPTEDDAHAAVDVFSGRVDEAKQEAASSSSTSLAEEMQGFTSASEIYSVRDACTCVFGGYFFFSCKFLLLYNGVITYWTNSNMKVTETGKQIIR